MTPQKWHQLLFGLSLLAPLGRLRLPFRTQLYPEEGPQIIVLGIMLEKLRERAAKNYSPQSFEFQPEDCAILSNEALAGSIFLRKQRL